MSSPFRPFSPAVEPLHEHPTTGRAWWFAIRRGDLLVYSDPRFGTVIPRLVKFDDLGLPIRRTNFLGHLDGDHVYAVELDDDAGALEGMDFCGIRGLYSLVDEQIFDLAGRALQINEWDRTHQYCGRCGSPTVSAAPERAKRCPNCGHMSFPRLSPAVIVLVEHGDDVLLARHTRTTDGTYALQAGFVEPGEPLEEAVRREIREETGIAVDQITYFGSQPWPFPHSLMIGFNARYAGGDVNVDGIEIADARWFNVHAMPKVPIKLSIARRLIDAYAAKHGVILDQP